jgi:hypothetical protein
MVCSFSGSWAPLPGYTRSIHSQTKTVGSRCRGSCGFRMCPRSTGESPSRWPPPEGTGTAQAPGSLASAPPTFTPAALCQYTARPSSRPCRSQSASSSARCIARLRGATSSRCGRCRPRCATSRGSGHATLRPSAFLERHPTGRLNCLGCAAPPLLTTLPIYLPAVWSPLNQTLPERLAGTVVVLDD